MDQPVADVYRFYQVVRVEQLGGSVDVVDHADVEDGTLADLFHYVIYVCTNQQLAAFDDADFVADIGKLGPDMAGDHDGFAHLAELF